MKNSAKYVIFRTKWGFFGLLAVKNGLFCAHLPCRRREQVENGLLVGVGKSGDGRRLVGPAQEKSQRLEGVKNSGDEGRLIGPAREESRRLDGIGNFRDEEKLFGSVQEKSQRLDGAGNSGGGGKVLGKVQVKGRVAERLENCQFDRGLFGKLQEKIVAYFEGELVEFGQDVPVVLDGYSEFGCKVLETCRKIKYGETVSYGQLAKMAGRANAARAVGGILGKNRLPLIVPCHRVIRSDGGMGGFSAAGGVEVKEKMLEMERKN